MIMKYNTKTFCDVWDNVTKFLYDYKNIGIPYLITDANATTLYYLLYAKFGNSPISNMDENQFKYKLFSIIWQYGPTWEKRLAIQTTVRGLTADDIEAGNVSVYNKAYNPSQDPSTMTDNILPYINEQNVNKNKKNKVGAYLEYWQILATDVTSGFLDMFNVCFKQFVGNERPFIYVSEEEA